MRMILLLTMCLICTSAAWSKGKEKVPGAYRCCKMVSPMMKVPVFYVSDRKVIDDKKNPLGAERDGPLLENADTTEPAVLYFGKASATVPVLPSRVDGDQIKLEYEKWGW